MALLAHATSQTLALQNGEEEEKRIHLKLINFGSEEKNLSSMLKCHLPNIIL